MQDRNTIERYLAVACDGIDADGAYMFDAQRLGNNSFAIYFEHDAFKGVKASEPLDAAATVLHNLQEVQDYIQANYI